MTHELPQPGQVVGDRFELFERLGEGGMAVVHRAHDRVRDRPVALKLLIPRYLGRPEREQRIVDEAEYLDRLQGQPGIVQLVAAGRLADHHDWPFLATELLVGRALQWVLIDHKFSHDHLHAVAMQIATALAACHAAGIVHRDVTPDNVFVDEATMTAKLFDFSHAGSLTAPRVPAGADGRLTGVHDIPGTGGYMAPEQAMAAPAITAMDVFAFGVLLHELVTGRNPFPASDRSAFIHAQRHGGIRIPRLDAWAYQLSEAWADLIESCTASDASERPSMARVVALLEVIDERLPATAAADSTQPIDAHVLEHLHRTAPPIRNPLPATERLGADELARLQHGTARAVEFEDAPTLVRQRVDSDEMGQPAFARKTAPPIVVIAPERAEPEPTPEPEPTRGAWPRLAIGVMAAVGLGLSAFGLWRWFFPPNSEIETTAPAPSNQAPLEPIEPEPIDPPLDPPSQRDPPVQPSEFSLPEPEPIEPGTREDPPLLTATDPGPKIARDSCRGIEDSGRAAARKLDWPTVLETTNKKKCWKSTDERARLRVEALLQSRRWVECVEAAKGFSDPKIVRWSQFCTKHL